MRPTQEHPMRLFDLSLRAFWCAACLPVALSSPRGQAGGSCTAPVLLQVGAARSKQGAAPALRAPSCPADGKQCTLIVVYEDGAEGISSVASSYEGKAKISHLSALGEDILDFGTRHADACCEAYGRLKEAKGVKSVEFDAPVYAIGKKKAGASPHGSGGMGIMPVHEGAPAASEGGPPAAKAEPCPAEGKQCTLLVVLKDHATVSSLTDSFKNTADILHLTGVGQDILDFGKSKAAECCDAYKRLQTTAGVDSVEFDHAARPIDRSGAGAQPVAGRPAASPCPAEGHKCTLIVVLNTDANAKSIAAPFGLSVVSHLRALGQVVLDFGDHHASECCSAYKTLQKTPGVKAVEFDAPVHAIDGPTPGDDRSGATLINLWPVQLWIMVYVMGHVCQL